MTTATPLTHYGAQCGARFASGYATNRELHHVRGHDPRTALIQINFQSPLSHAVTGQKPVSSRASRIWRLFGDAAQRIAIGVMERAGLSAYGQHRVFLVRPPTTGVHRQRDALGDGAERMLQEGARAVAESQRAALGREIELCRVRRHLADGYRDRARGMARVWIIVPVDGSPSH
jgi:hypothetical protein